MCELLALSSRYPANLRLSLDEFARHGGGTGPHRDGWGIAFYEGNDVRLYRDANSANSSPLVKFIEEHEHEGCLTLAHIRRASQGEIALRNCQPFARELGGVEHAFAHNGDLGPGLDAPASRLHRPIGETDSEVAFCELLHQLDDAWRRGPGRPAIETRTKAFADLCTRARALGPANLIYSDGECLFVHADRRKDPQGRVAAPGLWVLERKCDATLREGGGTRIAVHPHEQHIVLVASVPLTDERWEPMREGEILVAKAGLIERRHSCCVP